MTKNKRKIFWIASYPKSGNTWIRAIISSLFFAKNGIFELNLLKKIINFELPDSYKFVKEKNLNDYNNLNKLDIISKYRIDSQKNAKILGGNFAFYKTHSSNLRINNYEYTNESTTLGLIYIVRDPRDIAISYSKFLGKTIDEILEIMTSNGWVGLNENIPYLQSSWDLHYKSWNNLKSPKLIIKYEELLNNTESIIKKIENFFKTNYGFNFDNNIKNILVSTNFKTLQKLEKEEGFDNVGKSKFFRKGTANQWNNELSAVQLSLIHNKFKKTMEELKYL